MNISEKILDEVIKQSMIKVAHPDPEETHVFVWNSNVHDQLNAAVIEEIYSCKHEESKIMTLGPHYHWCSVCGAVRRISNGFYLGCWQSPDFV